MLTAFSISGDARPAAAGEKSNRTSDAGVNGSPRRGSMHHHASWHTTPLPLRVVLVHGFGSRAASLVPLADQLATRQYGVTTFQYDSHGGVRAAASELGRHLNQIAAQHPDDRVAIISHSMGGLVARWTLEQSDTTPTNVDRLIMIAPPNNGSALASLSAASLIRRAGADDAMTADARRQVERLDTAVTSLLGIAVGDLRPDSEVLRQLAKPNRRPPLRYSILAGSDGPMPPQTGGIAVGLKLAAMLAPTASPSPRPDGNGGGDDRPGRPGRPTTEDPVRQAIVAATNWADLAGQPEWVRGKGDGVVSIASTRLRGVDDHEVLPFRHNTLTSSIDSEGGRKLCDAIVDRLRIDPR